ncbi:HotDog domain-containing protein [Mycena vulgaris]|nr:HotDog domain-containing protein [Mycena vulgaris]
MSTICPRSHLTRQTPHSGSGNRFSTKPTLLSPTPPTLVTPASPRSRKFGTFATDSLVTAVSLGTYPLAPEALIFIHLGRGLCGHDGIIHGGLLATLLNEALAILNLPHKVGVTATLSLTYRAPSRADQFVILKTQLVEAEGRKAIVSGRVEALEGTLLVEAKALFIQPRYAKLQTTGKNARHAWRSVSSLPNQPALNQATWRPVETTSRTMSRR